jgi:hypothetical protein
MERGRWARKGGRAVFYYVAGAVGAALGVWYAVGQA